MKLITRTIKLVKMECIVYNTLTKQNETLDHYVEKSRDSEKRVAQEIRELFPHLRLVMVESAEEETRTLSLPLKQFIDAATIYANAIADEDESSIPVEE